MKEKKNNEEDVMKEKTKYVKPEVVFVAMEEDFILKSFDGSDNLGGFIWGEESEEEIS